VCESPATASGGRVSGARVGCFDQSLWFASVFLDYRELAVSLDNRLGLRLFVAEHDQEAAGISSNVGVERGVDREGDDAGAGSALACDRELWEALAASARAVDLFVEATERCLVECDLRETQLVLWALFTHPYVSPTAKRFRNGLWAGCDLAERGVSGLDNSQDGAAEIGELFGAVLEQQRDHAQVLTVEMQIGLVGVDGKPDAHRQLLVASLVKDLCKTGDRPFGQLHAATRMLCQVPTTAVSKQLSAPA